MTLIFTAIRRALRAASPFTGRTTDPSHQTPACAQPLERRLLLAGNVPLVGQAFLGPAEDVTAVVLTFAAPLDPATAANTAAYRIVRVTKSTNDGFFGDGEDEKDTDRVDLASATYDPATNAVTLVPENPFAVRRNFKSVRVIATGSRAVLTADGTPIDGDGDGRPGGDVVVRYRVNDRRSLSFREADGDRVKLRLQGPGEFLFLLPSKGRSSPTFFLRDTNAGRSVLTGTVKRGKRGDGIADIAQISGASTAQVTIAADPSFRIRALTP